MSCVASLGISAGRCSASRRGLACWLAAAGCLVPIARADTAASGTAVDLVGTWYVLVHYREGLRDPPSDDASRSPALVRWEDKLWRFERRGERMLWSEYPVVSFRDASGRFERAGAGRESRTLHAWQPSAGQRVEIRQGLAAAPTGARSKSMRALDAGGWESAGEPRASSASLIGYHERWRIAGSPQRPIFTREDALGGGRTQAVQGVTRYETEEVDPAGHELHGRYERDGVGPGRFWMWRSGDSADPAAGPRSQPAPPPALGSAGSEPRERLERLLAAGALDSEGRSEIRHLIRERVREYLRRDRSSGPASGAEGREYTDWRDRVERLTREIERLLLDDRRSLDEVNAMLADGSLGP